jgi:ABC-type multidrug transport system fused ATPase/permease subunit
MAVPSSSSDPMYNSAALYADTSAVNNRALLRWMFQFLRPVKMEAFLACFYLACLITCEIFIVKYFGAVVNDLKELHLRSGKSTGGFWQWINGTDANVSHLRGLVQLLFGLTFGFLFFRYLREVSSTKLSMRMVYYIREAIYDKIQRVGFGFHDSLTSGQLINRALTDLQNVRSFLQSALITTLDIVWGVGGYILLLITTSRWIALFSLIPLPIWTIYILRFGKKVQPASRAVMDADDKNVSILTENIAGVHVIKAFATERQEIDKYGGNLGDFFVKVLKRIRLFGDFTPIIRSISILSNLSLVFIAAVLIIQGKLQIGILVILGQALNAILGRLQQINVINEQYQQAIVSARRLYEVLMASATVPEKHKAKDLPPGTGCVKFENVTFGYDPKKPVLKNVSFEIKGGMNVAIVGPTGAGKSSLVNLVGRFYDAQEGRVLIDGVDVREASLSSIRTQVALVFQETYLFSDTVAANIAYGRPNVKGGEVEAAARLAQAHEFIENLPQGYHTVLAEKGSSLSGGQKQRLAIARAILFNPRVLILDDATAAVDPETEDLIRRGMKFVLRDRTVFTIAHRISTVKRADVVIVLENGRITQMGTHKELMEQDGHYREIAAVQLYGDDEVPKRGQDQPSHMDRLRDEKSYAAANAIATEAAKSEPRAAAQEVR